MPIKEHLQLLPARPQRHLPRSVLLRRRRHLVEQWRRRLAHARVVADRADPHAHGLARVGDAADGVGHERGRVEVWLQRREQPLGDAVLVVRLYKGGVCKIMGRGPCRALYRIVR